MKTFIATLIVALLLPCLAFAQTDEFIEGTTDLSASISLTDQLLIQTAASAVGHVTFLDAFGLVEDLTDLTGAPAVTMKVPVQNAASATGHIEIDQIFELVDQLTDRTTTVVLADNMLVQTLAAGATGYFPINSIFELVEDLTDKTATAALTDLLPMQTTGGGGATGFVTAADILALLPDPDYGGIYVKAGATPQSFTTIPTKLIGFVADMPTNGMTSAHATDDLTIATADDYKVEMHGSFTGTNLAALQCWVNVDGVESVIGWHRTLGSVGTRPGTAGADGILTLAALEVLTIYCESAAGGGNDMTIISGSLSAVQLR